LSWYFLLYAFIFVYTKLLLVIILMSSVSEIMSFREPYTITAYSNRTAIDVASIITEKRISSVIVIDKENRPLGIVTERDLVERVCLTNLNAKDVLVEDIMSSPLITIMAYDSVDTASRVMLSNKIKRLPVLEADSRIVGVISVTDITKHLSKILLDDYNRHRSLKKIVEMNDVSN
jgi:CBS domain-containing protein